MEKNRNIFVYLYILVNVITHPLVLSAFMNMIIEVFMSVFLFSKIMNTFLTTNLDSLCSLKFEYFILFGDIPGLRTEPSFF